MERSGSLTVWDGHRDAPPPAASAYFSILHIENFEHFVETSKRLQSPQQWRGTFLPPFLWSTPLLVHTGACKHVQENGDTSERKRIPIITRRMTRIVISRNNVDAASGCMTSSIRCIRRGNPGALIPHSSGPGEVLFSFRFQVGRCAKSGGGGGGRRRASEDAARPPSSRIDVVLGTSVTL